MNEILWRSMTCAQPDVRDALANGGEEVADWTDRSARLRARHAAGLDLRYGPRERNRLDLFRRGAADAPLIAAIWA